MRTDTEIREAVAEAVAEIEMDIADGTVPSTVKSFQELHDHVDANEYGGLCDRRADWTMEDAAKVQELIDRWIGGRR